jgi:hypothetical protein
MPSISKGVRTQAQVPQAPLESMSKQAWWWWHSFAALVTGIQLLDRYLPSVHRLPRISDTMMALAITATPQRAFTQQCRAQR